MVYIDGEEFIIESKDCILKEANRAWLVHELVENCFYLFAFTEASIKGWSNLTVADMERAIRIYTLADDQEESSKKDSCGF
jgi:hypothetical protein